MAQFDVYEVRGGGWVVDCQSNILAALPTRFVVPLRPKDGKVMDRLNPILSIDGRDLVMVTQLAGAIAIKDIRQTVGSIGSQDYQIKAALDLLIVGF